MIRCPHLLLICISVTLSSCGFLERNTVGLFRHEDSPPSFSSPAETGIPADPATVPVAVKPSSQDASPPAAPETRVEIVWEIPKDPVDGFIIRYGFSKSDLNLSEKVRSTALDRMEDPSYGFVYRHVLKDLPPEKPVYVTLTAFTGTEESEPSPIFEVTPSRGRKAAGAHQETAAAAPEN